MPGSEKLKSLHKINHTGRKKSDGGRVKLYSAFLESLLLIILTDTYHTVSRGCVCGQGEDRTCLPLWEDNGWQNLLIYLTSFLRWDDIYSEDQASSELAYSHNLLGFIRTTLVLHLKGLWLRNTQGGFGYHLLGLCLSSVSRSDFCCINA